MKSAGIWKPGSSQHWVVKHFPALAGSSDPALRAVQSASGLPHWMHAMCSQAGNDPSPTVKVVELPVAVAWGGKKPIATQGRGKHWLDIGAPPQSALVVHAVKR